MSIMSRLILRGDILPGRWPGPQPVTWHLTTVSRDRRTAVTQPASGGEAGQTLLAIRLVTGLFWYYSIIKVCCYKSKLTVSIIDGERLIRLNFMNQESSHA